MLKTEVVDNRQVKLVAFELRSEAAVWWEKLQANMRHIEDVEERGETTSRENFIFSQVGDDATVRKEDKNEDVEEHIKEGLENIYEDENEGHMTGNKSLISEFKEKGLHKYWWFRKCLFGRATVEDSWNWHKRLSHLKFNNINELVKKDLVRGFPNTVFTPDGLCDSCQKVKLRKSSFKSKTESSILESYHLLHIDLFGPVNVICIAKKRYALVIIDEFTRYTWVYFLYTKNETPSILLDHVRELKKGSIHKVNIIRSDNETEFKNNTMEEFFKYKKIKQELYAPETLQQSGVVERKDITFMEDVRTMLEEEKLLTYLWDEAVQTTCFIQNTTLINKHGKSPFEMVNGKKPNLAYSSYNIIGKTRGASHALALGLLESGHLS
ncbi:hypothetical protein AgCh_025033 [Apium graveolens]